MKGWTESSVQQFVRREWGTLVGIELCFDDCGKPESFRGEKAMYCSAREKRVRDSKKPGVVPLSLNGALVGLLALVVPSAGESLTLGTELAYTSCQSESQALV